MTNILIYFFVYERMKSIRMWPFWDVGDYKYFENTEIHNVHLRLSRILFI